MSKESLGHPGAEGQYGVEFDAYLAYFNPLGLTEENAAEILEKLRKFHAHSSNPFPPLWQPGSCPRTRFYFYKAEEAFEPLPVTLWFNPQFHYWYQVQIPDGSIVIDPTGLPKNSETLEKMIKFAQENPPSKRTPELFTFFKQDYAPYFGLIENAPEVHHEVYTSPESVEVSREKIAEYHNSFKLTK